ncbi:unnamed protein product [Sphagnum compactum]
MPMAMENLSIAQHRDTLRYAHTRGGSYKPKYRRGSSSCLEGCGTVVLEGQDTATVNGKEGVNFEFRPVYRSGVWSDTGRRTAMEDAHVCIDNLQTHLGSEDGGEAPGAFYGVFDGHGGKDAAFYVKENVLQYILDDVAFPTAIEDAVKSAFLRLDDAFAKACSVDHDLSSGTTALTALLSGRNLLVANAGDCRAVLCRRGNAVEMSRDHKPGCLIEKLRIEKVGGYVDDGYLNGQLSVARAIGDWHMAGLKDQSGEGPLSAEPEMQHAVLTEEDEFLVIGCDGLWDVFTSQNAVDFARKELQLHNDPERCCRELVAEALRRYSCDNLTVLTVCFKMEPPPQRVCASRPRAWRRFSDTGISNLQGFLNDCPPVEGLCNL